MTGGRGGPRVTAGLRARLRKVRLLVLDVDGVLTDGGIYYTERGDEIKKFHVRDGQGLVRLRAAGVVTAIVSGRRSAGVARRARELGVREVHQGAADKLAVVRALLARHRLRPAQAAMIGDDVGDLAALGHVGLAAAVADAVPAVRRAVHYVTRRRGGEGAVRELCDLLLAADRPRPRAR
ncbi:MAG TPA: HAD hydrolase family protein [Methylomirabilota bacterium]|nr:HAD hydrolase family protein [Methylomirabilota bacterium]